MAFSFLPALHLEAGAIREAPEEDPAPFVAAAARKHGEVVLVDADGLQRNTPDLVLLQAASRSRVLWVDAGSRTLADVSDLFIAGASRVTARWNTFADSEELRDAAEVAEELYLGVEVGTAFIANPRDRIPLSKLASLAGELNLPVVLIDLAARGAPSSTALNAIREFTAAPEVWYMGVATRETTERLAGDSLAGAILPFESLPEGS